MATIRKRVLPTSGETRWQVDFRDSKGRRKSKQFRTKAAATEFMAKSVVDLKSGAFLSDQDTLTLREARDQWLDVVKMGGAERWTLETYRRCTDLHLLPFVGETTKLTKITTATVADLADRLRKEGRSPNMVARILTMAGAIFVESIVRGQAVVNPVAAVKAARRRKTGREARENDTVTIPTRDEVRRLLDAAAPDARVWCALAAFSGLRASEIRGLKWAAIDLVGRTLEVRERADMWGQSGPPKSRSGNRTIPLGTYLTNTLKEHRLRCPHDRDLVLANAAGKPLEHINWTQRVWIPTMLSAGLWTGAPTTTSTGLPASRLVPRFSPHSLRHFYASMMLESGISMKRLQTYMGHSAIAVTMDRYSHLLRGADDDHALVDSAEETVILGKR